MEQGHIILIILMARQTKSICGDYFALSVKIVGISTSLIAPTKNFLLGNLQNRRK
eukprot:TRINITY_DN16236_c0_g1_i1.p1 TRINITY_DN16236_c0_g1~~TRINITY_DN16236_c0_g1_i1.p1  ORF type:complete len:55 (+),score=8.56 TRINITY_DN16236_c0_g1_i1:113-277(+)